MLVKPLRAAGYTLIELTLVVFLIGLFVSLSIPRLQEFIHTDPLHTVIRKLTYVMIELRGRAAREHHDYLLHFDFAGNRVWWAPAVAKPRQTEVAREEGIRVPEEVDLVDIWTHGGGKKADGEATILFTKRGYAQQTMIHLRDKDDVHFSLEITPFLERVTIHDRYVDIEERQ